MVVRKYFEFIEIWTPCPICEKLGYAPMINLRVSKEEINRGLSMGIYTHNFVQLWIYAKIQLAANAAIWTSRRCFDKVLVLPLARRCPFKQSSGRACR